MGFPMLMCDAGDAGVTFREKARIRTRSTGQEKGRPGGPVTMVRLNSVGGAGDSHFLIWCINMLHHDSIPPG